MDLTAIESDSTFCAFSDCITVNPARPAAESGNAGATEQIMTLAWLIKSDRIVLFDSMQAAVVVSSLQFRGESRDPHRQMQPKLCQV